jgi:hypothetical protein
MLQGIASSLRFTALLAMTEKLIFWAKYRISTIYFSFLITKKLFMPTVVVRHKVGDFETWLKGHEDRVKIFAPAVSTFKTFQDQDDPTSVVLVLEVTDMEKLGAIMNDPNTQEAKDRHTVKDPIILSIEVTV